MSVKEFFGKFVSRYLMLHLLAMAVVLLLLLAGVKWGLGVYTHHGEGIELPDLTGMDFKGAVALLAKDDLVINVTDSGYNKKMPPNTILTQMPGPGTKVKAGRVILVTLNSATLPSVRIPDLIDNSSYREAQARLTSLGFKMLEPKRIDGERDWVYGILHRGRPVQTDDMIPTESELMLVIGNGYDEDEEDMDSLLIDSPADAGLEPDDMDDLKGILD